MWKIEQLKFMLENAFFTNANEKYHISHELAGKLIVDIIYFCIVLLIINMFCESFQQILKNITAMSNCIILQNLSYGLILIKST